MRALTIVLVLEGEGERDNPQGQRAALARMVANGVELCGELQVASKAAPRGFWESVAQ